MEHKFSKAHGMRQFLINNKEIFEEKLLTEAINVRDKIDEIHLIGNINLLENAYKLVLLVVDNNEHEVKVFSEHEGVIWAKFRLTLSFKLEWLQAIRRTMWYFLNKYDQISTKKKTNEMIYDIVSNTNDLIDQFLNGFFISYSRYKDDLIHKQREMVEKLSVPIIPITESVHILPLIGTIDTYRATIIEEKVLFEVGKKRIQKLIMDLSGIVEMDSNAIHLFSKLLNGISMMGSEVIITGLRPEIIRQMMELNIPFGAKVKTKGSLLKVLQEDLNIDLNSEVQPTFVANTLKQS